MTHPRYLQHAGRPSQRHQPRGFALTTTPEIPDDLIASACLYWQAVGQRWCEDLPDQIAHYLDRWNCEIETPLRGASTAYVARVRRNNGSPAVLKITYPEIHGELDVLRAYGKTKTVEVFEGEGSALLLEWCEPGTTLRDSAAADEAFVVTLDIMHELWATRPIPEVETLAEQCRRHVDLGQMTLHEQPELAHDEILRGLAILEELGSTHGPEVLLHGDLHPGNILRSSRQPWLVIDPKPLLGDPAYETIPLILEIAPTQTERLAEAEINARIDTVAARLGLSPKRIAQWGAARRCDWALFCHRASQPKQAEQAEEQLRLFLAAIDTFEAISQI